VSYSPKDYWSELHQRNDLSAVGQSALPEGINKWIYSCTRRNLSGFARRHRLAATDSRRMLEVGVGTGYWVNFWKRRGWTVDGCDLVPSAVEALKRQHQGSQFWQADVSSTVSLRDQAGGAMVEGYDLVTAINVLLHVTEDDAFQRALANVAAAVRPGGHLLLVEPAFTLTKRQAAYDPSRHSRARLLESYQEPLRDLGLELVAVEPTTVLAANPLEASSSWKLSRYRQWWRLVVKTSKQRPSMVRLLGPAMYLLDAALMRTKEAPTSKVLLLHRPP
jgi:2-polyprenyl-3-methyl-5-hydroxy-6-metoxy-1,4-benzoquinol methylase